MLTIQSSIEYRMGTNNHFPICDLDFNVSSNSFYVMNFARYLTFGFYLHPTFYKNLELLNVKNILGIYVKYFEDILIGGMI